MLPLKIIEDTECAAHYVLLSLSAAVRESESV